MKVQGQTHPGNLSQLNNHKYLPSGSLYPQTKILLTLMGCSLTNAKLHIIHISISQMSLIHDDVIKWKHFPRYWPFVLGIHRSQRPVTRRFDAFFDLRLNKRLSKQSWGWWFETPSGSLWRRSDVFTRNRVGKDSNTKVFYTLQCSLFLLDVPLWSSVLIA